MPVADELAALRALGTVKATSTALSSTQSTDYVFTTPQQQEQLRKQKLKQEKAAREAAEKYLRKHNAGGINDLWYKKLRELKARKKAGGSVAWKKKEKTTEDGEEEVQDDEDVGLEVGMLPDHLVKALKAKYETENAEEALDKALKDEEEGKGTILSEVMADIDVDDNATETKSDISDGDEKKTEEDDGANEEIPASVDGQAIDGENEASTADCTADKVDKGEDTTEEKSVYLPSDEPDIEIQNNAKLDSAPTDVSIDVDTVGKDGSVEEVRTKIEQLSIEDVQVTVETDKVAAKGDVSNGETKNLNPVEATAANSTGTPNLFYNTQSAHLSTCKDSDSQYLVDLLNASERATLDEEQNAKVKAQLIILQDQIKDLLASW